MKFILVENLDEVFAVAFEKSERFIKRLGAKRAEKKQKTDTAAA
jgi:hypothetical protein